ncbi:MAG: exosortase B [Caldimonas sp.]
MSSVLPAGTRMAEHAASSRPWLIALAGFAAMYLPVYLWAAETIWQSDEHAHGAIVLVVVAWLFWTLRKEIITADSSPSIPLGGVIFGLGILVYTLGRVFSISIFELGSQIFVISGVLLLLKGPVGVKIAWFPIFYLLFLIPLPGILVDAITGPLKQWISTIVVSILYAVGYPIAQSGVVISIGQYQLLVADACSGLHSMFSLAALGTLFMYLMKRPSKLHNSLMLASILPIAFVANICRVIILVLITYHFGDEAGQGFLHGTAGFVLMMVALLIFFALDSVLNFALPMAFSSNRAKALP